MHEQLIAQAVIPTPYRIMGLDMMPYSLGNELQLFRDASPFLLLNKTEFDALGFEKQCLAVIRGVNVCCRKAPSKWFGLWAWMYRPRTPEDLALLVAEFTNYLNDGRLQYRADLPQADDTPTRFLGEPEIARLYRFVCAKIPREERLIWGQTAWDFPYSFAKMLAQGYAEGQGGLEIYNLKKKTHDDYHTQCQEGREAWTLAGLDPLKRRAALEKHPIIRDLAGLEAEVATFEQENLCPA